MKNLAVLASIATLSACVSTGPRVQSGGAPPPPQGPAEYGYKPGESAPTIISEHEFEQLTMQLTDLYNQRATLGQLWRGTADSAQRARYASDIDRLNRMIAPLEYRMRAANRPLPPAAPY
ncbi:hypothetical protein [Ramlibacter albus]|uniref:Lipoprotein n=1 Tax=Ramlibacter albus TaxID=2079448 RepID=A0A923M744_9BURK|nr:hypothetical protein [Ramlibacter albus]MBC5764986.1 hypothetical protein [Ramlibacter albus]